MKWSYVVREGWIHFVTRGDSEEAVIRHLDLATGAAKTVAAVGGSASVGLTVSLDEQHPRSPGRNSPAAI